MKSLEIVNEMVDYWESAVNVACQSNAENGYYDELDIVEYQNRLKKYQQIKQDLEVLETILDNCENKFLDILHECLIRGTPIHTEDIQRLSEYINRILTIKKQWLEENENDR